LTGHLGIEPGRAYGKVGPDGPDGWILLGLSEELLDDSCELLKVSSARVLQLQGKAPRGAESPDGRGVEGQDERLGDLRKFSVGCTDDGFDMLVPSLPFIPVMQRQEHRRGIWPSGVEDEV